MDRSSFPEAVQALCARDKRYAAEAYFFVREGLDYTVKALKKNPSSADRHVSGRQLAEGLRDYALEEFGPLALTVLQTWGIQRTEDFGELVFNLIETGKLGKSEQDNKSDFAGVYEFHEVFAKPFEVVDAPPTRRRQRRGRSRP